MKFVADAFGCDCPEEFIRGCANALAADGELELVVTGDRALVEAELKRARADCKRVEIVHAPEIITCEESPTVAIRVKKNSSLVAALERTKTDPEVMGMVSAGSTGALLTGGLFKLGRIDGVDRPALAPTLPTAVPGKYALLVDAGANADCKPGYLAQFAMMGSVYMKAMYGVGTPRVGLLSNGTEDAKGSGLVHEAFALCRALAEKGIIDFAGNIEGRDILAGGCDVVVADGFSGNVALKSMEGTANTIFSVLKSEVEHSFRAKLGALILKPSLRALKNRMDYNRIGGAAFLGVEKLLIKAHGASKASAVEAAFGQLKRMAAANLTNQIRDGLRDMGL